MTEPHQDDGRSYWSELLLILSYIFHINWTNAFFFSLTRLPSSWVIVGAGLMEIFLLFFAPLSAPVFIAFGVCATYIWLASWMAIFYWWRVVVEWNLLLNGGIIVVSYFLCFVLQLPRISAFCGLKFCPRIPGDFHWRITHKIPVLMEMLLVFFGNVGLMTLNWFLVLRSQNHMIIVGSFWFLMVVVSMVCFTCWARAKQVKVEPELQPPATPEVQTV